MECSYSLAKTIIKMINSLLKSAHSDDIWLHTKDIPGSHVIIDTKGDEVDEDTLFFSCPKSQDIFSKARGSSKIPVDYVECRYLKKIHQELNLVLLSLQIIKLYM